ncbi:inosine/xanthosine triphosphatase [archaeon]
MKIAVGSERKAKQEGVRKAFAHYYDGFEVVSVKCSSGVSDQPMTDDETMEGAINRARAALEHGDLGVGIESGIKPVKHSINGYLNTTWCAIIDKDDFLSVGSSPDFEYPKKIVEEALAGTEVSASAAELFGVDELSLKESGVVGELTRGVCPRSDYIYLAVLMAIAPRLHPELF